LRVELLSGAEKGGRSCENKDYAPETGLQSRWPGRKSREITLTYHEQEPDWEISD
jgi:hypothetical protein